MPRAKTAPHPAFAAMLAESARTGLPQAFTRDLTEHDRAWVTARDPKAPFMWALRECGTHSWDLTLNEPTGAGRLTRDACDFLRAIDREGSGARFYLWDGVALQAFPSGQAAVEGLQAFIERERARLQDLAARYCQSNPSTPHEWRGAKCTFCDFPKPQE